MKIASFVTIALALALAGSALVGAFVTGDEPRIVLALAGDPSQW